MRKDFGPKTWFYPMPVLIIGSYNEDGTPNAMNAAWGGIYDYNQVILCLSDEHKTTENIKRTGAFTLHFGTRSAWRSATMWGWYPARTRLTNWHGSGSMPRKAPLWKRPSLTNYPWPWNAGC